MAITDIIKSSNIKARASITIPKDGNVSNPENGGARNEKRLNIKNTKPINLIVTSLFSKLDNLGLENFSNHLIILINLGRAEDCKLFGSSLLSQLFGNQTVFRPDINSIASNIAIISNILVIPPVGIGRAEAAKSNKNRIAKLFSAKLSNRSFRVLGCLLDSSIFSL